MNHVEYEKIKAAEWQQALDTIAAINASTDPLVRYKTSRPVIDIKHMWETSAEKYADSVAFHVK
ncbi:MAG: hypothetical protein IJC68_01445, partial [Firmicutes bacterium]|nr:hypothetical protein [Bacillota bacterium]